jgi:[acyl-carrier-protein] S-malonyltransferase
MGKELADQFPAAKAVFDEVDSALGQKLSTIIFEGSQETLTLTENAQPAIMATSMAALRVMQKEFGFDVAKHAAFVAGHSLGEYSALCAAGVLSLSDTARLLKLRGQSMQQAVPQGQGAMAALIGADLAQAEDVAKAAAQGEVCSVANDNAPGQVVISGHKAAIDRAIVIAKEKGIKRALLLEVSAPFHSPLMAPAAEAMREALANVSFAAPCVPVVANVIASAETSPDKLRDLLMQQVTGVVRWRESMHYLKAQGVTKAIEIGAGKVLSGMVKRIEPEIECNNIGVPADLTSLAKAA